MKLVKKWNVQSDGLKAEEITQFALKILVKTTNELLMSLHLKPKGNEDLGQKHLFTYKRKLKKTDNLN